MSYLLRRGASYYARTRVPTDLVSVLGKKELVKALGTKDRAEAKRLVWPVVEGWNLLFDDVRTRRVLTATDKADAVWQHYTATLQRDEEERQSRPTQADIDAASKIMFDRANREKLNVHDPLALMDATLDVKVLQKAGELSSEFRATRLAHMRKQLAAGETALVNHSVTEYLDQNRLIPDPTSDDVRDLARQMMRSEIEGLERTLERDRGHYGGVPSDPIVKPANGPAREFAKPGESIMDLFDVFARENPKRVAADRINQMRRDIGTFIDTVGSTCPVRRINKKAVREWKALLMQLPVKATESTVFAGMTLPQIVMKNREVGKPIVTVRTVNRYLSSLGAFCGWLETHGYIDVNPCSGMFLAKEKKVSTYPFTTDQLNKLFASPLFTGCQSDDLWRLIAKPGNVMVRDHRYWVPLVMLFSGARPGEIGQLGVADVREQHGHWIMHITTEGDGEKTVKTAGSMRVIPIHSQLIRLGFLKHHAAMKDAGETRLFPEAKRNSRGQMIAETSREFGRYLERIGLKEGRGLSLYSFRHGATDAWRRAGHLDDTFGFMLGHTSGTMTGRYGIMPQGALEKRFELIEAISYPGVVLDHLAPPA
ncbi:site-specific integrase [Aureimonas sp. ME7]|uniref:site-specific integrase n=1 Tax=Aureimonas sp. ME7 TaxID=2744252 RepID=UPI0015F652EF|nr:site-specific integrase [Aureimonas sp. ME7]